MSKAIACLNACLRAQAACLPFLSRGKLSTQDANNPFQNRNQRDGAGQRERWRHQGHGRGLCPFRISRVIYKLLRSRNSLCFNVMVGRASLILKRVLHVVQLNENALALVPIKYGLRSGQFNAEPPSPLKDSKRLPLG